MASIACTTRSGALAVRVAHELARAWSGRPARTGRTGRRASRIGSARRPSTQRVPVAVDLVLALDGDEEREGRGERVVGPPSSAISSRPAEPEPRHHHGAARPGHALEDRRVVEHRGVEGHGLPEPAVEPQERGDRGHGLLKATAGAVQRRGTAGCPTKREDPAPRVVAGLLVGGEAAVEERVRSAVVDAHVGP